MSCSSCAELRENLELLQETARKAGLAAQARAALKLARQYMAEGDEVDSPRVLAALLAAMELAKEIAR